jgi:hypothetical protein
VKCDGWKINEEGYIVESKKLRMKVREDKLKANHKIKSANVKD